MLFPINHVFGILFDQFELSDGGNGPLSLSIPLQKYSNKELSENIRISYEEDWQTKHWRSFESAYRNTAYFEFYEDEFKPFYTEKKVDRLMDFNLQLEQLILDLINVEAKPNFTLQYIEQQPDWRLLLSPKSNVIENSSYFPYYPQAFSDQHNFRPNLSIVDLLFNLGPASSRYLKEVRLTLERDED
jgi:hypothetical protein